MGWKVYRQHLPANIFNCHDEAWVSAFTAENPGRIGLLVSVLSTDDVKGVYWKLARCGAFSPTKSA